MKLQRIQIVNFRSIKDIDIEWDPNCIVLVGINESGKSNILRAMSMLSADIDPIIEDERESLPDEDPIKQSYVRFVFNIDREDWGEYEDGLLESIGHSGLDADIALNSDGVAYSIKDLYNINNEGVYQVDVIKKDRKFLYWSLPQKVSGYKVVDGWKKPSSSWPDNISIKYNDEISITNKTKLVFVPNVQDTIPDGYLDDIDFKYIWGILGSIVIDIIKDNLPECNVWQYNDANLLPGSIPVATFSSNPNSCMPLRHMFELSGYKGNTSILNAITKASQKKNGMSNLLKRVARLTTDHIREIWKDYKNIEITLAENGANFIAGVRDEFNDYEFSRRSDGFKRFVTFLLMISAKARVGNLRDTIIIVDEPDIGMHPSGARYLRDELIKISENNNVVYSSHSIFMIDKENIGRHFIVSKKNEVTTVERAGQSNITDEEVLYNALGYSVFESLNKIYIVFEGWRDKKIFIMAINKRGAPQPIKNLKNIGICHAKGVKDIGRITPLIELANRECWIIADNDSVSLEHQREYEGYGTWLGYADLLPQTQAKTGEDFVKIEAIRKATNSIAKACGIDNISEADLANAAGRIEAIKRWLRRHCDEVDVPLHLNKIKEDIFNNLTASMIEDEYFELLTALSTRVIGED